jgi:hypothetical protein
MPKNKRREKERKEGEGNIVSEITEDDTAITNLLGH